jgi:lysophospholipase L1-like esterase
MDKRKRSFASISTVRRRLDLETNPPFDIRGTSHCISAKTSNNIQLRNRGRVFSSAAQTFWTYSLDLLLPVPNFKLKQYRKEIKAGKNPRNDSRFRKVVTKLNLMKQLRHLSRQNPRDNTMKLFNDIGTKMTSFAEPRRRQLFDNVKQNLMAKVLCLRYNTNPLLCQLLPNTTIVVDDPHDLCIAQTLQDIAAFYRTGVPLPKKYSFILSDSIGAGIREHLQNIPDLVMVVLPGCGIGRLFNFANKYLLSPQCHTIELYGGTCTFSRKTFRNNVCKIEVNKFARAHFQAIFHKPQTLELFNNDTTRIVLLAMIPRFDFNDSTAACPYSIDHIEFKNQIYQKKINVQITQINQLMEKFVNNDLLTKASFVRIPKSSFDKNIHYSNDYYHLNRAGAQVLALRLKEGLENQTKVLL